MVAVGQGGKFGLGRYGAISGRKRPLFDACKQIYQENFGQGLHSGRRQEMPWGRDPLILVAPPWLQCHVGDGSGTPLLQADLRVSRVRVRRLGLVDQADMCHAKCF